MSADEKLLPQQLKRTDITDCLECKITGSLGALCLGFYMLYNSGKGKNANSKPMRIFWRSMAAGAFYMAAARVFYFPPFASLKDRPLVMDDKKRQQ